MKFFLSNYVHSVAYFPHGEVFANVRYFRVIAFEKCFDQHEVIFTALPEESFVLFECMVEYQDVGWFAKVVPFLLRSDEPWNLSEFG